MHNSERKHLEGEITISPPVTSPTRNRRGSRNSLPLVNIQLDELQIQSLSTEAEAIGSEEDKRHVRQVVFIVFPRTYVIEE